jgi:hypothetical protein
MGMFDYFRSSYDLGEQFTNVVCQTKDIEEGIGGTMTDYWLDPSGKLWHPRYIGCHTIEIYEEGHPRYDPNAKWANFEWIPTGARGKLQHHPITKYIEIYPAEWDGKWEDWPRLQLHFKRGELIDFEDITGMMGL